MGKNLPDNFSVVPSDLKQSLTMTAAKDLQDFITALQDSAKGSIPINTTFDYETTVALFKYAKDKKMGKKPQPVIRSLVIAGLKKAGYL